MKREVLSVEPLREGGLIVVSSTVPLIPAEAEFTEISLFKTPGVRVPGCAKSPLVEELIQIEGIDMVELTEFAVTLRFDIGFSRDSLIEEILATLAGFATHKQ
jgi:hypothetical protein